MALSPLARSDATALRWLPSPGTGPTEWSLLSGDRPVARLNWLRKGSSTATAKTIDRTWTLTHRGFLSPQVIVEPSDRATPVARLVAHLRHHTIEIAGGATYRLHRRSLLLPAWTVSSTAGEELLHIEPVPEGRRLAGGAVVGTTQRAPTEFLLLAVLAWYFIVLVWFEDEAAEALAPFEGPDAPVRPD